MDLTTQYLGLKLKNPLVLSASPLTGDIDNFKKLEDAGMAAIVMHSLFEEQIRMEANELEYHTSQGTETFAESLDYFPQQNDYILGPQQYLEQIKKAKQAVQIPVIASLNGFTTGGWTEYAKSMQDAGADALELNIYFLPTSAAIDGQEIEQGYLQILQSVKKNITIPVAVKLNPFFSSIAGMARQLTEAGADGLVLFNRFYQPDIDIETLEVLPSLDISSYRLTRLPLRWIAILHDQIKTSLAATSGIMEARDVVKMLMAGADVTMLCSTLLAKGIPHAAQILADVEQWMRAHGYESVSKLKGIMSQKSCPNPDAFERANYMKVLRNYRGEVTV